jgi:N-acetylglutamate synthase-like GNAT family acetyltransferase
VIESMLAAYDAQLREDGEVAGMGGIHRRGPLLMALLGDRSGFITYGSLVGAGDLLTVVADALAWFAVTHPAVGEIEWKTRGHDAAPGLHEALVAAGFSPDEPETVMAGLAERLAGDAMLDGASIRRAGDGADLGRDVERAVNLQAEVFERPVAGLAERTADRLAHAGVELWIAEAGDEVVGVGRLDVVAGTDFGGLWGGSVRADWRGRGVYRALTRARATAALAAGASYLYADCTELSRPILERCGLVPITTTTPYVWRAE